MHKCRYNRQAYDRYYIDARDRIDHLCSLIARNRISEEQAQNDIRVICEHYQRYLDMLEKKLS